MQKILFQLLGTIFLLIACTSNINQYKTIGKMNYRNGKWVEKDSVVDGLYVSKGKYKIGDKIGVWKTYFNNKLYQKDKTKDSLIKTKTYFTSRKLRQKGQSKLIKTDTTVHWYISGTWKYYNEKRHLLYEKTYHLIQKPDSISYQK